MPDLKIFRFFALSIAFSTMLFSANIAGQDASVPKCGAVDYNAQIVEANKGIEFSIYNVEAYIARGIAYSKKTEYDKALQDFNRALEINLRDDRAFYYRGVIYDYRGNHDKAILDLKMAIEINPRNADAYSKLAQNYDAKGKTDLAIENYGKAIALDPESNSNYYNRGRQYYISGNKIAAKQDFKKASDIVSGKIELIPKECRNFIYFERGSIADVLGNSRQALADYNSAINLREFDQVYLFRGNLYFDQKNYKAAIADYTKAIELDSQWAKLYRRRAEAYEKIGELDKAEADRKKYEELSNQP